MTHTTPLDSYSDIILRCYADMATDGILRETRFIDSAVENGRVSQTRPGREALAKASGTMLEHLQQFRESRATSTRRRAFQLLDEVSLPVAAHRTVELVLNRVAYGDPDKCLKPKIETMIGRELSQEADMRAVRRDNPTAYRFNKRKLVEGDAGTRAMVTKRLLGSLEDRVSWDTQDMKIIGGVCLGLAVEYLGIFKQLNVSRKSINEDDQRLEPVPMIVLTEAAAKWFDESLAAAKIMRPTSGAVPHVPLRWESDGSLGGFLPDLRYPRPLISRTSRKDTARALEDPRCSVVIDALSVIQETQYKINERVLEAVETVIDDEWSRPELIPARPGDAPEAPGHEWDGCEECKAYKRARADNKSAAKVFERSVRQASRLRIEAHRLLEMSGHYYVGFCDFRGRLYTTGGSITPQSNSVGKGLLLFAEGEPLGTTGLDALFMHFANCMDVDKISKERISARIEWARTHTERILAIAENWKAERWWTEASESCWGALACAFEIANALNSGSPETYVCSLPVASDASTSALQISAMLVRDHESAYLTNCVDKIEGGSEKPRDLYTQVANVLTGHLRSMAAQPAGSIDDESRDFAKAWLAFWALQSADGNCPRSTCKTVTMTSGAYGSTWYRAQRTLWQAYIDQAALIGDIPDSENPFKGDLKPQAACTFLANQLWEVALPKVVPGSGQIREWIYTVTDALSDLNQQLSFVNPLSGFRVTQRYFKSEEVKVRLALMGERRVQIRTTQAIPDTVDRKAARQGSSPQLIHSLDAALLSHILVTLREAGIKSVAACHDSVSVTPNHVETFREVARHVTAELFSTDVLGVIKASIEAEHGITLPDPPCVGDLNIEDVRTSSHLYS